VTSPDGKLRVLQVLPDFGSGGAERMAVYLVRTLNPDKYRVAVISLFDRTETDVQEMVDQSGARVWYLHKRLGFDPRMYIRIGKVLQSYRPHIIHTHKYVLRYIIPFLFYRGTPAVVHTVHNIADKEVDALGITVNRICFKMGVVPVAIAGEVADSLERVYAIGRPVIIPNGIAVEAYRRPSCSRDTWRAQESLSPDDIVFTCVATLRPQKNHALLLRAFAQGPGKDQAAHLVLVGDGVLRSRLEAHAAALGIRDRVHFLGLRRDVADILSASDVFVLASDWEGNPLSVMEAMAAGKPVVATAVGGVPELVEHEKSGLLVRQGDEEGLAAAMARLMNPEHRRRMGEYAQVYAELHFGVDRMTRAYEELYGRLLHERNLSLRYGNADARPEW